MVNKKLGNEFEQRLCELLNNKWGFWAHNFVQSQYGQPADIIAVKNGKSYLIDCKVCTNNYFRFDRMEENQIDAMTLWEECGNGQGLFALLVIDKIFILTKSECDILLKIKKRVTLETLIKNNYRTLEDWIKDENNCI